MSLYQVKKYPQFLLHSKNQHGVHSPFVFELIHEVFSADKSYYCFDEIERERKKLLKDLSMIEVIDLGAGSHQLKSKNRSIAAIAKNSLTDKKHAQILFRLANKYQPKTIIELGTSLGIMTAYLSKACPKAEIISFEGCPNISDQAKTVFERMHLKNIEVVVGDMDDTLSGILDKIPRVDFVFIDGNHRKEPTINYTQEIIKKTHHQSIVVLDDIYWSAEMTEAWERLKMHPKVSLSIDIFHKGFLFFRKGIEKQHFYLRV